MIKTTEILYFFCPIYPRKVRPMTNTEKFHTKRNTTRLKLSIDSQNSPETKTL